MSPPDWGAEFTPLPARNQAAERFAPSVAPGSTRSSSLPGLSIGPEVFPAGSSATPTSSRTVESRVPGSLPTAGFANGSVVNPAVVNTAVTKGSVTNGGGASGGVTWPSQVEGNRVPAQPASVLRRAGESQVWASTVAAPQNTPTLPRDESFGPQGAFERSNAPQGLAPPSIAGLPVASAVPAPGSPSPPMSPASRMPQESPSAYFPTQPGVAGSVSPASPFAPGFDPGFRRDGYGGNSLDWLDQGQQFPHETQQHYPPMSEILKTGRYFGSLEWQLLQPHLQNNTALIRSSPGSFSSQQFNWTYESAPQFRAGFESKYGPGVELEYWQFDHDSSSVTGISDGVSSFTSVLPQGEAGTFNQLSATAAGDRLTTRQGLELHSAGISFFKEMKLPISRLAGTFGLRYLSIAQQAEALRLNSSGTQTGSLSHITDFRGFGPRIRLDYFRPVGHTKLESIASFGSSLLYGNRDQFVTNSLAGGFTRTNADEFVTSVEAAIGVQYVKHLGENRSAFVRLTYQSQTWLGGGTGTDAAGDLGFRGLGISIGANR